ncbi:MAG: phosphonate C-P lyase system protein PhnG [Pseudomonadales bacterium]|nr:phosphonate C-P lyase system protein PhnG [Pseudomonadales bacterium]
MNSLLDGQPGTAVTSKVGAESPLELRQLWLKVLARASAAEIKARFCDFPAYRLIRAPEVGMALAKANAGSDGQTFHLGEMTMTRCVVLLESGETGFGFVLGRDKAHAEYVAVLDAMLQRSDNHSHLMAELIMPLAEQQREKREQQARTTQATKVDFFTMVRGE